jgi:hypothetical protein
MDQDFGHLEVYSTHKDRGGRGKSFDIWVNLTNWLELKTIRITFRSPKSAKESKPNQNSTKLAQNRIFMNFSCVWVEYNSVLLRRNNNLNRFSL